MRVGQGFDLHRLAPGIPFVLGGVRLDWPQGPEGHSDGDVLLHALIDALLGATGKGDIGDWFPPTDERWRGADSATLLQQVMSVLHAEGWQVVNVDSTVLLEAPKLKLYKSPIRERLAELMGIPTEQVSLKAKTMEGLGPIGEQNAVAAMINVLLERVQAEP